MEEQQQLSGPPQVETGGKGEAAPFRLSLSIVDSGSTQGEKEKVDDSNANVNDDIVVENEDQGVFVESERYKHL